MRLPDAQRQHALQALTRLIVQQLPKPLERKEATNEQP
jgi:hypothetical protein